LSSARDSERVLRQRLAEAIAEHAFPGAVLLVGSADGPHFALAVGTHTYDGGVPVRDTDLFDLASLTKVVGTTSAAMRLHDRGLLDLDRPVADSLPAFTSPTVTPRQLLAHCSGLPAYVPFHRGPAESLETRWHRVLATPLECAPATRTVYSDVGMMVLGILLARLADTPLAQLVRREVCAPLTMGETGHTPSPDLLPRTVPTEYKADGVLVHGVVHDENARWLDGVAGHAGLFAPAGDLAKLCVCLLRDGEGYVRRETLREFVRPASLVPGSTRCLGWHGTDENCSGGRFLGPGSYGHTGFTGTSIWIDPANDLFIILLTNAVHPKRECKSNGFFAWRRALHETVYQELGLGKPA
jgi:CubicO group peptidase (beta-lactamase class C family)